MIRYGLDDQHLILGIVWNFLSSPPSTDRLWGHPSLLSNA